jgi:hypothetical protein
MLRQWLDTFFSSDKDYVGLGFFMVMIPSYVILVSPNIKPDGASPMRDLEPYFLSPALGLVCIGLGVLLAYATVQRFAKRDLA